MFTHLNRTIVNEFATVDEFRAAFDEKTQSGTRFITIFEGTINEANKRSWCPDCVLAKPHIDRIIDASDGQLTFIKANVTRKEWGGNSAHPYRFPPFGATGVPTMTLYEGTNQLYKVDNLQVFADNSAMDKFLEKV